MENLGTTTLCFAFCYKDSHEAIRLTRTEVPLVTALLKHVEPDISEVEIQRRFEIRGRKVELDQIETLLMQDGYLDMASDIIDPSDHAALKKIEKLKAAQTAPIDKSNASKKPPVVPKVASGSAAASSSSSSSPAVVPGKRKPVNMANEGSVELHKARQLMPPGFEARLKKDVKLHFRWAIDWPRKRPPHSFSKSWGPKSEAKELQALALVLTQAWAYFVDEGGTPCPWDFSGWLPEGKP